MEEKTSKDINVEEAFRIITSNTLTVDGDNAILLSGEVVVAINKLIAMARDAEVLRTSDLIVLKYKGLAATAIESGGIKLTALLSTADLQLAVESKPTLSDYERKITEVLVKKIDMLLDAKGPVAVNDSLRKNLKEYRAQVTAGVTRRMGDRDNSIDKSSFCGLEYLINDIHKQHVEEESDVK